MRIVRIIIIIIGALLIAVFSLLIIISTTLYFKGDFAEGYKGAKTIEKYFSIDMTCEYERINSEVVEAWQDWEITEEFKFSGKCRNEVQRQIETSKYFNINEELSYDQIESLLEAEKVNGYWTKNNGVYKYRDVLDHTNIRNAKYDSEKGILIIQFGNI